MESYSRFNFLYFFLNFGYNSSSIDPRDMERPPFDASSYDESNKLCFVIFQSQDGEIMRFENFLKKLSHDF